MFLLAFFLTHVCANETRLISIPFLCVIIGTKIHLPGSIKKLQERHPPHGSISVFSQDPKLQRITRAITCKCSLEKSLQIQANRHHLSYIYGGYDPINSIMYDDVWILSLPSFTWTKAYSGENARFGHTCHSAGKRQMMSVGGSLNASMYGVETSARIPPDLNTTKCDPREGVAIFDLTSLAWGSFFNPYAPEYQVPQKIVNVIGGTFVFKLPLKL
jgi:hypothetical protein